MRKIPFSPPFIDDNVKDQVMSVLESGWITTGPKTLELEKKISDYLKVESAITCNSWSSGAQIVLTYLGIGPGDEVLIPNYTYSATALAVFHVGAKPVLVDVDDNYQLDLKNVERLININTKAIIPVDIGGLPTDVDGLTEILQKNAHVFNANNDIQRAIGRVAVISDSAHSFGATIDDKKVGSIADFTVFSLHAVKNLTSAEGGIISFNLPLSSAEVSRNLKLLRLNGQTKDALAKTENPGNWEYDIVLKGYKMNMPDICAAIALGQLSSYNDQLLSRKRVVKKYLDEFSRHEYFTVLASNVNGRVSSNHLLMIQLNDALSAHRNEIINKCAEKGVSLNVHFKPLSLMTAFTEDFQKYHCPNSISLFNKEISLPIYPHLTDDDVVYISKTLVETIEEL